MRLILLLLLLLPLIGEGQVDSLKSILTHSTGKEKIEALNELAWELSYDQGEEALGYAKEALNLARQYQLTEEEATAHARIGLVYDYQGRWEKALENYTRSLELRKEIGEPIPISNAWNNIGAVYHYTARYEEALNAYIESLNIREASEKEDPSAENKKLVAQSLNNIAIINRITGNFEEAIKNYERSLEIKKDLQDFTGQMTTLTNMGVVYQTQEKYEDALDIFTATFRLAEEHGEADQMSYCLNNLGITYKSLEQYDKAEAQFNTVLNFAREKQLRHEEAVAYVNLAALYYDLEAYEQSIESAKMCYDISSEIGYPKGVETALQQLSSSYEALGRFQEALDHHRQYVLIKDSLLNDANTKKILELSAKYDAERKENKIEQLNAEKTLDQSRIAGRNYLILALGIGILLVIILGLFVIRNIRIKRKTAEERAAREIEKHLNEIDLLRANIQNQLDQTEKFKVGISRTELNAYLLNPLSERELEVMYLLADGKSNKEIAEELFVSVNTIKTHVLRIYEKLDVQNRTQAAVKAGSMNILK